MTASTASAKAMSVAVGTAQPLRASASPPRLTATYTSAGATIPPTAAATGSAARRGSRRSPATISRLSSRPATKKKIASSPSAAHAPSVRSRCSAAGPTTVSRSSTYDEEAAEFAHTSATTRRDEQQCAADRLLPQDVADPPGLGPRPAAEQRRRRGGDVGVTVGLPGSRAGLPTRLPGAPADTLAGPTYDRRVRAAGVVLAGGRSSRMGTSKASLEWHGSTLLRRTCGVLQRAGLARSSSSAPPASRCPPAARTSRCSTTRARVWARCRASPSAWPRSPSRADVAFVCSTDLPFLHAELVRRVLRAVRRRQATRSTWSCRWPGATRSRWPRPTAPGSRRSVAALVAADRLRPAFVFEDAEVLRLDDDALLADPALRAADPTLESVRQHQRARRLRDRPGPGPARR